MTERLDNLSLVQELALKNADQKIGFGAMVSNPTVVIDLATSDFWPTLKSSLLKEEALSKIRDGSLIPINADALTDITQGHSFFHTFLQTDKDLIVLPTFINYGKKKFLIFPSVAKLDNNDYQVPVVPNTYVKKQSFDQEGRSYSHGGVGITIVRAEENEVSQHFPTHIGELLQPFIMPPTEKNGTAFVRDVRVFVVGGKSVVGIVRRAAKPLLLENIKGEVKPELEQIYSARLRGPKEPLKEPLRSAAFAKAERIHQVLTEALGRFGRPFSSLSPAGFLSFDFLIDANYELLPVDCDVQPMVDTFQRTDKLVARALADFLVGLAEKTGERKQVVIDGILDDSFIMATYEKVKNMIGQQRTIFVESLLSQAIKELGMR